MEFKTGINQRIFQDIFNTYFNALCAFGYKYIKDNSIIEDFVQEAFVSLWEKRENFNQTITVKAFLYTTLRNRCLNHLKHQAVLQKHEQTLLFELESEQFFKQHVIEEEVFNQLHLAIQKLPESAKKIMFLALNGLTNNEIAEELGVSINTVKTQKKIAYSKVKDKISPLMQGILMAI